MKKRRFLFVLLLLAAPVAAIYIYSFLPLSGGKKEVLLKNWQSQLKSPVYEYSPTVQDIFVAFEDQRFREYSGHEGNLPEDTLWFLIPSMGYDGPNAFPGVSKVLTMRIWMIQDLRSFTYDYPLGGLGYNLMLMYNTERFARSFPWRTQVNMYMNLLDLNGEAHKYFNRDINDLTIAEAAACIIRSVYPFSFGVESAKRLAEQRSGLIAELTGEHWISRGREFLIEFEESFPPEKL